MIQGFYNLPKTYGVYIFKDDKKRILYVGKAINLKARVSNYFNRSILDPKTLALVNKINSIDHIVVQNELEALILEADLIKRYKPPYNITLKDDKFYKYIKIYEETISLNNDKSLRIKKIKTTRKKTGDNALYFGPYPKTNSIYSILRYLRKIFPYMSCSKQQFNKHFKSKRPCIYGQIGLCVTPCVDTTIVKLNNQNVSNISKYLEGQKDIVFKKLERQMLKHAKKQEYEKAQIIRDQLRNYEYLTQPHREITEYTKNPNIQQVENIQKVKMLIDIINENGINIKLTYKDDFRIETYDISNFQGSFAVGSMVVFRNGTADTDEYRRFKIKTLNKPNDFGMMREILERRFEHKRDMPNLIVIDGGKGQLSSALQSLQNMGINIPTIGLAKKKEEIVIVDENNTFKSILLDKRSPALNLLIQGRNEAHRFAITYYRKRHLQNLLEKRS